LRIAGSPGAYICKLGQDTPINRHRPSVEALFDSVNAIAGRYSMGILLTGMGADGAEALLRMRENGILTVAQDEHSSVVWGMPGVAVKLNAAEKILPLSEIHQFILEQAFV